MITTNNTFDQTKVMMWEQVINTVEAFSSDEKRTTPNRSNVELWCHFYEKTLLMTENLWPLPKVMVHVKNVF